MERSSKSIAFTCRNPANRLDNAVFNDSWNIDAEPVNVGHDGIVSAITESENDYFSQYNTTIRVEDGKVVEIKRVYVP